MERVTKLLFLTENVARRIMICFRRQFQPQKACLRNLDQESAIYGA